MKLTMRLTLFLWSVCLQSQMKCVLGQSLSFEEPLYTFTTQETAVDEDIGVPDDGFLIVRCTSGEIDLITYDIPNRISLGLPFRIHATSGNFSVAVNRTLDYEEQSFYAFQIECFNSVDPGTSASAMVTITLIDVNEFAPEITGERSLLAFLPENAPVGTTIASTLPIPEQSAGVISIQYPPATDRDGGPHGVIRYDLSPDDDDSVLLLNFLDFNPTTGTVTLAREGIDVDNIGMPQNFNIELTACDTDTPRDLCPNIELNVVITAANDNDPTFIQDSYRASLNESVPVGTSVVTPLCTDNDVGVGALSGYTIFEVDPPSDVFAVRFINDIVIINSPLDYETAQEYRVVLRCYDSGGREDFANLTVTVEPLNDNEPEFTQKAYEFTLDKLTLLGQTIGRVEAIDNDTDIGGDVTYTLVTDNPEIFSIEQDGSVTLNTYIFAFQDAKRYNLTVQATDGTFTKSVNVIITTEGSLTVPEIIVIIVGGILFLAVVVLLIICCCYCCVRRRRAKKERTESRERLEETEKGAVRPGSMLDQGHGQPFYMIAQSPDVEQWGYAASLGSEGEIDYGSLPSSSRQYQPSPFLKEMVDYFHEGDKVLKGGKKAKGKKK